MAQELLVILTEIGCRDLRISGYGMKTRSDFISNLGDETLPLACYNNFDIGRNYGPREEGVIELWRGRRGQSRVVTLYPMFQHIGQRAGSTNIDLDLEDLPMSKVKIYPRYVHCMKCIHFLFLLTQ